ncbi:MAG: hypothetical protein QXK47_02810 [Candidatus Bathyarchaeia archaeon]
MHRKKCWTFLISLALYTFAVAMTVPMLLLTANTDVVKAQTEPHPADAMWVEPSMVSLNAYVATIGYTFNITVWVNVTSEDMFAWQFKLYYNNSHLQATRAGYTGPNGANSEWAQHRTGGSVATVTPDIRANYVMITESCVGDYFVPKGTCASLAWIEFNVTALPPQDGELASLLDIDNTRTWVERFPDLEEIPIAKYSAEYHISYVDNIPPRIGDPTQTPSTNVQPGQTVKVSVNVADPESGVKNVTLYYTNDTTWYSIPMAFNGTSGLWEATIPGHDQDITIKYKIEAYDNAGNHAVKDNAGAYYVYTVVPEFTLPMVYIMLLALVLVVLTIRFRNKLKN